MVPSLHCAPFRLLFCAVYVVINVMSEIPPESSEQFAIAAGSFSLFCLFSKIFLFSVAFRDSFTIYLIDRLATVAQPKTLIP